MVQCKKCKAWVKDLSDHLRRNRCEAVIARREARGMNIGQTLGTRGKRTANRNENKKSEKK
jgi:hypothetical protein